MSQQMGGKAADGAQPHFSPALQALAISLATAPPKRKPKPLAGAVKWRSGCQGGKKEKEKARAKPQITLKWTAG